MSYQTSNNATIAANEVFGALKEKGQLAAMYLNGDDVRTSIVKATNRDIVAPKGKHVAVMLSLSFGSQADVKDIMTLLDTRIRNERNWIVAMKALICVHYLLREGDEQKVQSVLQNPQVVASLLNQSGFRDNASGGQGMEQARNVRNYAAYLEERVAAARDLKQDHLRVVHTDGSSTKSAVLSGRRYPETKQDIEALLRVMEALTNGKPYTDSINNEVTAEAFRLITIDLLNLFGVLNEAVLQLLAGFFDLELKVDAVAALQLYEKFAQQTAAALEWLDIARRIKIGDIPDVTHAPLSLAKSLRDYVESPDFDSRRRERGGMTNVGSSAPTNVSQQTLTKPQQVSRVPVQRNDSYGFSSPPQQQHRNDGQFVDLFAAQPQQSQAVVLAQRQQQQPADLFAAQVQSRPQAQPQMAPQSSLLDFDLFGPSQSASPQQQQQVSTVQARQTLFGSNSMAGNGAASQQTLYAQHNQQSTNASFGSIVGPLPGQFAQQQQSQSQTRQAYGMSQFQQGGNYSAPSMPQQQLPYQQQQQQSQSAMMTRQQSNMSMVSQPGGMQQQPFGNFGQSPMARPQMGMSQSPSMSAMPMQQQQMFGGQQPFPQQQQQPNYIATPMQQQPFGQQQPQFGYSLQQQPLGGSAQQLPIQFQQQPQQFRPQASSNNFDSLL